MMTRLYLITHPDVIINPEQAIDEWVLSEKGIERAKALMSQPFWNTIQAIYTSTEPKAKAVAEMASQQHNISLFEEKRLVEIDRSSTGLLPYDEFMNTVREFFKAPDVSCRGWETANTAMKRVSTYTTEIMANNVGKNIVLVGHGASFALLLCHIKGIPPTFGMCQDGVGFIAQIDWESREITSMWTKY